MPIDKRSARSIESAPPATHRQAASAAGRTQAVLHGVGLILAVAAGLWLLYRLEGVILLVVLSIFFAYLIAPLVDRLSIPVVLGGRPLRLPRSAAIGAVYVIVFGTLAVASSALLPRVGQQLTEFGNQLPTLASYARDRLQAWRYVFDPDQLPPPLREAVETSFSRSVAGVGSYVNGAVAGLLGVLAYLPWLVLIPVLAFFFLKDAGTFRRSVLRALPGDRQRGQWAELSSEINETLAAYIRAALTACLLIGIVCTVGFLLIGLRYGLLLGIVAGLFEFIPLVGPLIVAVGTVLLASMSSAREAVAALIFLGVLRIVQDYVIYPRLIGRGIHLHPVVVILAILSGAELAGLAGIFLAIPVVAVLSVVDRQWKEYGGGIGATIGVTASPRATRSD